MTPRYVIMPAIVCLLFCLSCSYLSLSRTRQPPMEVVRKICATQHGKITPIAVMRVARFRAVTGRRVVSPPRRAANRRKKPQTGYWLYRPTDRPTDSTNSLFLFPTSYRSRRYCSVDGQCVVHPADNHERARKFTVVLPVHAVDPSYLEIAVPWEFVRVERCFRRR